MSMFDDFTYVLSTRSVTYARLTSEWV